MPDKLLTTEALKKISQALHEVIPKGMPWQGEVLFAIALFEKASEHVEVISNIDDRQKTRLFLVSAAAGMGDGNDHDMKWPVARKTHTDN